MKNIAWAILLASVTAFGQTSAITATITDSDSQTWNNGNCTLTIYSPNGVPTVAGTPLTAAQRAPACAISSSGVLTATVVDTSTISPTGAQWTFTISPNATSGTYTIRTGVTGATPNLSATLSAGAVGPRFPAGPSAYGYLDVEISPTPLSGGIYYNVTNSIQRIWNGSAWANNSSSGGAPTTCTNTNNYPCLNTANAFTANNLINGVYVGADPSGATYQCVSWNGTCTDAVSQSIVAGGTGDPNIYLDTLTGGGFNFRVASGGTYTTPITFSTTAANFTPPISQAALGNSANATIASSGTISPVTPLVTISGTTTINIISLPTGFTTGCFDILATGAWATGVSGNIQAIMTAVPNTNYRACYFAAAGGSKWFIK